MSIDAVMQQGLGSLANQASENLSSDSSAMKNAAPGEKNLRTQVFFSELSLSFPTTDRKAVKFGAGRDRLLFPAYITSFSDSFTPNWTPKQVFGRSDPIPTYSHTTRQISFTVRIPCFDETDANVNLKKINALIKNLYPSYKIEKTNFLMQKGSKIMNSPPLVRVKFANLISSAINPFSGLLGYITSCTPSLEIEKGVFLVSPDGNKQGLILPRSFSLSISFTPLHEHTLGWTEGFGGSSFEGGVNFPYAARNKAGAAVANVAQSFGLGSTIDEDVILKEE